MDEISATLLARAVERLRAIADENRVRLLLRLRRAPANVGALAAELSLSQPSVSKHLAVLKAVGLVEVDRVGTQAVYRVRDASVFDMCKLVCDGVIRHLRDQQAELAAIESPPTPPAVAKLSPNTSPPSRRSTRGRKEKNT